MLVEFIPKCPILYDWIAVVAESVLLHLFVWKYSSKHSGLISFLIIQMILFGLFVSWNNIFLAEAASAIQPINTFAQMLLLAPAVSVVIGTMWNVNTNLYREKEEENVQGRML